MYKHFFKRLIDILLSGVALFILSPVLLLVAILVRVKLGSPVIFKQERPGYKGKIFRMYKFRTMIDPQTRDGRKLTDKERLECIEKGIDILTDEERLPKIGRVLRSTSLDELPELVNILVGDMSIIGPRPQLVRDMVFMSDEQRMRHTAKPGLSGLAQVKGRNAITWEEKLNWDLKYIENVSFWNDIKIVFLTIKTAFIKAEGITDGENATALDYGDALLKEDKVSKEKYDVLQAEACNIITKIQKR